MRPRARELRYGPRRVAEVHVETARELTSHERGHLVRVLVNAEIERVDDGVPVGGQVVERAVAEVETRLTDTAHVGSTGQVVQDLELRRLLVRETLDLLVGRRLVDGRVEGREAGVVLG